MSVPMKSAIADQRVLNSPSPLTIWNVATWAVTAGTIAASRNRKRIRPAAAEREPVDRVGAIDPISTVPVTDSDQDEGRC